jgi:hypothetical protein
MSTLVVLWLCQVSLLALCLLCVQCKLDLLPQKKKNVGVCQGPLQAPWPDVVTRNNLTVDVLTGVCRCRKAQGGT